MDKNILKHYGVLGMRWGRRRKGKVSSKGTLSEEHVTTQGLRKKNVSSLSNAEIEKTLKRLNLEKQFRESQRTRGQKLVEEAMRSAGKTVLTNVATATFTTLAKNVLGPSLTVVPKG